ncbi:MAG TPA: hypothetical protein VK207_08875 [Bacteroidales bacterium]|nr:hypothetical protein [Bacteroidales bacterium]
MVKKIIFVVVSVVIVVAGYIGFGKLSYFERSVRIFRMDNQSFSGRAGRGFENGGQFRGVRGEARPDFRHLPDSVRRTEDSSVRGSRRFEGSIHGNEGRRGDFRGREKVSLQSVGWFLAVFASFTVITICIEKLYRLFHMRKL